MANWAFTQGVHDIGNGVYGYVQPDGTWGWSNAGLIVSRGETLLVDTLMSRSLTRTMLADFARVDGGDHIDRLVNTHANPDHFVGNGLVEGAEDRRDGRNRARDGRVRSGAIRQPGR